MKYLEFGKVIKAHGVKGALSCDVYFEDYKTFCKDVYIEKDGNYNPFPLEFVGGSGDRIIFSSDVISKPEDVMQFAKSMLYVPRNIMPTPPRGYYMGDLIGMTVLDVNTNQAIGVVMDVVNFGALDMMEIKNLQEKLEYLEIKEETIVTVDLQRETVIVKPYEY